MPTRCSRSPVASCNWWRSRVDTCPRSQAARRIDIALPSACARDERIGIARPSACAQGERIGVARRPSSFTVRAERSSRRLRSRSARVQHRHAMANSALRLRPPACAQGERMRIARPSSSFTVRAERSGRWPRSRSARVQHRHAMANPALRLRPRIRSGAGSPACAQGERIGVAGRPSSFTVRAEHSGRWPPIILRSR